MDALLRVLRKTKKLDPFQLVDNIIRSNNLLDYIIKLNTESQLFNRGISTDGMKIVPPYAKTTKSIKRRKGQPSTRVTLKDTGDMYKTWEVKLSKLYITITANLIKKGKNKDGNNIDINLEIKYGKNIVGLTDENLQKLINKIKREFKKEVLKQILN